MRVSLWSSEGSATCFANRFIRTRRASCTRSSIWNRKNCTRSPVIPLTWWIPRPHVASTRGARTRRKSATSRSPRGSSFVLATLLRVTLGRTSCDGFDSGGRRPRQALSCETPGNPAVPPGTWGRRPCGRWDFVFLAAGRDLRPRRGKRVRQDDDRADRPPPPRAHGGNDLVRWGGHHPYEGIRTEAVAAPDADYLPGSTRLAEPRDDDWSEHH